MRTSFVFVIAVLFVALCGGPLSAQDEPGAEMPWSIGGVGGAYLLVEPGELEIELFKRDLHNTSVRTDLRAILAGPDREVLHDLVIPHLGGRKGDPWGPVQRDVMRLQVDRPGIYALNISTKGDRYGLNVAWGLRTNAAAYVVETARGHRDVEHEEPIVLLDADRPADVGFLPRASAFEIEVEALPADVESLSLFDESGSLVAEIPVAPEQSTRIRDYLRVAAGAGPEGAARYTVPADESRGGGLWRLRFPRGLAFVSIEGVTRWNAGDRSRDHAVWTPDPASWFHHMDYRWLISPYARAVWVEPGADKSTSFVVHNNTDGPSTVTLALDCVRSGDEPNEATHTLWMPFAERSTVPASQLRALSVPSTARAIDAEWSARLSEDSVALGARESRTIEVSYAGPTSGSAHVCYVQASPENNPAMTTYATLTVSAGDAPASQPLSMPLELEPYAHENALLGYEPDYPVDNQVYFDLENRPFVLSTRQMHRLDHGVWVTTDLSDAVQKHVPDFPATTWQAVTTKVAFDRDNDVYLLARSSRTVALLHSIDNGATFTAYQLPGREDEPRTWDIEQFSGHNTPDGPPPVVRLTRTYQETETGLRWRSMNDLDLFLPAKSGDGSLVVPEPLRLTESSLGFSMHSGIPSTVVSRDAQVHVVWGEATNPDADRQEIPGVPAYVATYDATTGELGEPVFLSFGPPPNDGHNTPSITLDGTGYLHVVVGTHGSPFQYLKSLQPNDAYAGWSEPTKTSDGDLRQTYVGLVAGADDALHLVFRQWRSGDEHLDGATWAALAYQRKPVEGPWEPARALVAPPLSEYSIYYHRLTVDRAGALFLSYDYWSTMWFYRNDQRGAVAAGSGRVGRGWGRAVLTSEDGDTWSLW